MNENNKKSPKTWSDIKDQNIYKFKIDNDSIKFSSVETPIEKSATALLKIHQLIEVGYGGKVTKSYINKLDKSIGFYTIYYNHDTDTFNLINTTFIQHNIIAFKTIDYAEEFLSYLENVQLLKDYFMIND